MAHAAQVCYWDGSTDTDWATDANWTGTAAEVPEADDIVVFDGRQVTAPTTGMGDDGANYSGTVTASTFDLLHFKSTYTGGIGTAALPLICSPDKVIIDGTGTYHICCGVTNQNTDTTTGVTIINNKDAIVYLYSNANDGANTTEFDKVFLFAGTLHLAFYTADTDDQGVYVDELHLCGRGGSDMTVTIAKDCYKVNGTVPTDIWMHDGTLTADAMIGTLLMDKGTVNYGTDLAASPETDLNITELRQYGGTFNWRPDDSGDDAYIATMYLFGGMFDASSTTNNDRAKVLGNGAGYDVYVFEGATLNIRNGKGNITLATNTQLWSLGGTVDVDNYTQLALTYDAP